jgi:hypothetical protein
MMTVVILLCSVCIYFHNIKNPCLYIILMFAWVPLSFQDKNIVFYHNPIFLMWLLFPVTYLIFEKVIRNRL